MPDLISIFCEIDDFCNDFEKQIKIGKTVRGREAALQMSEIMTITIWYYYSGYSTFKDYYTKEIEMHLNQEFPKLVSYNRFIELRKTIVVPMLVMLETKKLSACTDISFIDSFKLQACHIKRESSHKTLKRIAAKGKTSMGWFYGMKVHLVINHAGEIISFYISSGNIADNNEEILFALTKNISGKLFGDKGYIVNSQLFETLFLKGIKLITGIRKNMKNKLMELDDKLALRRRGVIESVGDVLKEHLGLEHTRHRSIWGFFLNIFGTLIAYQMREKKPNISSIFADCLPNT